MRIPTATHEPPPPASPKPRRSYPACRTSFPFRSRHRRGPGSASLFRANRMCARARVRVGAVRAPDCAREPSARRTSPVRSSGIFSHRCEAGDEAARGCRFLPSHTTTVLQGSSPHKELFQNQEQNSACGRERQRAVGVRAPPRAPSSGDGLVRLALRRRGYAGFASVSKWSKWWCSVQSSADRSIWIVMWWMPNSSDAILRSRRSRGSSGSG